MYHRQSSYVAIIGEGPSEEQFIRLDRLLPYIFISPDSFGGGGVCLFKSWLL